VNQTKKMIMAAAAWMLPAAAFTANTFNSGRIGAEDVAALEKFYMSAFGLLEVNRFEHGGSLEVMMNFGKTAGEAKANTNAQIVIMHRDSNAIKDPVPHLIFNVTDIAATSAAIKTAGGSITSEARQIGNSGIMVAIAADPAGNLVELLQPKS
jgi:predicted enzyme related to lactoylglutathione lyase